MIALGSFIFMLPHFTTESYLQSMVKTMDLEERKSSLSSSIERKLCSVQHNLSNDDNIQESTSFGLHHPYHPKVQDYNDDSSSVSFTSNSNISIRDQGRDEPASVSLS